MQFFIILSQSILLLSIQCELLVRETWPQAIKLEHLLHCDYVPRIVMGINDDCGFNAIIFNFFYSLFFFFQTKTAFWGVKRNTEYTHEYVRGWWNIHFLWPTANQVRNKFIILISFISSLSMSSNSSQTIWRSRWNAKKL